MILIKNTKFILSLFFCISAAQSAHSYIDSDQDGIPDNFDDFPENPFESRDTDLDGIGDSADNCRFYPNSNQLDVDQDGVGNVCEPNIVSSVCDLFIEPDNYPAGTNISNLFDGVVLSYKVTGEFTGLIYSADSSNYASTGLRHFSPSPSSDYFRFNSNGDESFKAKFDIPIQCVSIDLIPDDSSDPALLTAYDIDENVIGSYSFNGVSGVGVPEEGIFVSTSANISSVIISAVGQYSYLDNLRISSINGLVISGNLSADVVSEGSASGVVVATDTNGVTVTSNFSIILNSSNGQATINSVTGEWQYTADTNFIGHDPFIISATDIDGNTIQHAIDITIDLDEDNDLVINLKDNCKNIFNPDQLDIDGDNIGDECDEDKDGDGILNINDAFPDDDTEQNDTDSDLVGDNIDNCINVANQDQSDIDGDLLGDVCDSDMDGDGFANIIENTFGGDERDSSDYSTVMDGLESFSTSDQSLNRPVPAIGDLGLIILGISILSLGVKRYRRNW